MGICNLRMAETDIDRQGALGQPQLHKETLFQKRNRSINLLFAPQKILRIHRHKALKMRELCFYLEIFRIILRKLGKKMQVFYEET